MPKTCALRAPTVFSVRTKAVRTENAVIDKCKNGVGLSIYQIAD
jgi:hypothetical protein